MVKVKICGNRSTRDLNAARGAAGVGFIVSTPESSRNIKVTTATRLIEEVRPFTSTVLVTTETDQKVLGELSRTKTDYLQLHSSLTGARIEEIANFVSDNTKLIALLKVDRSTEKLKSRARDLASSPAEAILLDSAQDGQAGGTGKVHDWEVSRTIRDAIYPAPVILAGGLNPENVGEAIRKVRPYAVDVATGVEKADHKSDQKAKRFLEEVNRSEVK
ncbi:MAG: phosphoribosylanthranilate isomerase [Candidatus Bipolaricaulia bacterium]